MNRRMLLLSTRSGGVFIALTLILVLAHLQPVAAQPTHDKRPTAPLDLASMMPLPAEIEEGGGGDTTTLLGATQTAENALRNEHIVGSDPSATRSAMTVTGWRHRYFSSFDYPALRDGEFGRTIMIGITDFADADGASAWIDYLADPDFAFAAGDLEPIDPGASFGDEQFTAQVTGNDDDDGFWLLLRRDRIVADLLFQDRTPEAITIEDVIALAGVLEERIDTVLAGEGVLLRGQTVRIAANPDIPRYGGVVEGYLRRDGIMTDRGRGEEAVAYDTARWGGATDVFTIQEGFQVGESPDYASDPLINITVAAFGSESEARDWVDMAPVLLQKNGFDNEVIDDAATFGDHSMTIAVPFTRTGHDEEIRSYVVLISVGTYAAWVEIAASKDVPVTTVGELAALQVDCLEQGVCDGPVDLPAALLGQE